MLLASDLNLSTPLICRQGSGRKCQHHLPTTAEPCVDLSAQLDQGKVSNKLELTLMFPELAKHPVSVGIMPLPAPIFQQSRLLLPSEAGDGQTSRLQLGTASNGQVQALRIMVVNRLRRSGSKRDGDGSRIPYHTTSMRSTRTSIPLPDRRPAPTLPLALTSHWLRSPLSCRRDQMLWILPACSGWLLLSPQEHWCLSITES